MFHNNTTVESIFKMHILYILLLDLFNSYNRFYFGLIKYLKLYQLTKMFILKINIFEFIVSICIGVQIVKH